VPLSEVEECLTFVVAQTEPRDMYTMFDKAPRWLVECISDLLKFDPGLRLTSRQCLAHEFLGECEPEKLPCVVLNKDLVSTAGDSL
jgi:meiosis induction protein kinase IME2/SME1